MKYLSCCFWALSALLAHATIDATLQMQLGNPSNAGVDTNNHSHYLIQRPVEALDYNDSLGEPNWASWDLTAGDRGSVARSGSFFTDTNLPPNFYRVTDNDYVGVGNINFTRGHMCPSEDRTDTRADNDMVFLMSNMVPQHSVNNSGVWGTFEGYCRDQLATNELLIICGPSGFGTNKIPSGKAYIPDYVWKVVVIVPTNGGGAATSRINAGTRVIAIKTPNNATATSTWQHYVVSASQIETDTGLTFFSALAPEVAAALRAKVDSQQVPTNMPPAIFTFSPTAGAPGTNVVIVGTNFSTASTVAFNGSPAVFTVNSNTQITATLPAGANSGLISVTAAGGTAVSANTFTVTTNGGGTGPIGIVLAGWDVSTQSSFGVSPLAATASAANVTVTGLTRGTGVTASGSGAAGAWGGAGFASASEAAAVAANQFVTFGLTVGNGYTMSFTSISRFDYRRSGTGPTSGVFQFQVGNGAFTDVAAFTYGTSGTSSTGTNAPINLTTFPALQSVSAGTPVTFRIVNYNGGSGGTWYINDYANSTALDLAVAGTVTPVANTPAVAPVISLVTSAHGQFQFTVSGTAGSNYVIQAAANLTSPDWTPVLTNAAPFVFVETNANRFGQRFYRGVIAP